MGSLADDFDAVQVPTQAVAAPKSLADDFDATPTTVASPIKQAPKGAQSYEGTEADVYGGIGETAARWAGGALAPVAGGWHGIYDLLSGQGAQKAAEDVQKTQNAVSQWFAPKTDTGQAIQQAEGKLLAPPKPGQWGYGGTGEFLGEQGNKVGGPVLGAAMSALPTGVALAVGARSAFAGKAELNPEALPGDVSQYAPGGSAASSLQAQLSTATTEVANGVKSQIAQAQLQFGNDWRSHVDFDALNRQLEADSLPVPGRLAGPQAAQEPTALSDFMNNRGKDPRVPQFLQWQNKNLSDNLSAIREQVGPRVVSTDMPSHGQTLMDAYQKLDAPKVEAINNAYQQMRDANGGAFPVDAPTLLQNINESLSSKLLSKQDPGGQLSELTDLARRGGMTMENYLNMRQNLGDVARTSADPSARTAASTMIDQLEKLPLDPGAPQQVKTMADTARAMARQRFQELDADPAYKAAIDGSMAPEDFVKKFVINGKSNTLPVMAQNLAGDDLARQTMGTAVIDHLRDAARLNPNYEGNFAADSFNKQLQRFAPNAESLFQKGEGQTLQTLANYAKNSTAQPRGSFVNNSGTMVATARDMATQKAKNIASGVAEAAANRIIPGLGTVGREWFRGSAQTKAAAAAQQAMDQNFQNMTQPGAGVVK